MAKGKSKSMKNQHAEQVVVAASKSYFSEMADRMERPLSTSPERTICTQMENLLKGIGKTISRNFDCISQGTDHDERGNLLYPDFVLVDKKHPDAESPKYGVIEAKEPDEDISDPFGGRHAKQMLKYFYKYNLLTVTNFREFRLYGPNESGKPECLEVLTIADSKKAFQEIAKNPKKAAEDHGTRIWEFLKRTMRYRSSISDPQEVAMFLASYARETLGIIRARELNETLKPLKQALEVSFGDDYDSVGGKDRFCSTLVQTLFYGMFSAWATLAREGKQKDFNWWRAGSTISMPIIQTLFDELTKSYEVKELGLEDVLERASGALRRVNESFFDNFDSGSAIQHFYQPFLKEFDPAMQRKMGVWYTPPEIVQFQVGRVDKVLRDELLIEDGLANDNVYILDPCCGTGTYIIEVLRKIKETLDTKRKDGLVGHDLQKAAMERVKGFELMPAPFVIAHWQVGEALRDMDAPPLSRGQRLAIYLTNALTGRDEEADQPDLFHQNIRKEHELSSIVKKKDAIMVVIGNPPYNAFAGKPPNEAKDLTLPYRENLKKEYGVPKSNFNDPYLMFMRMAEMQIEKLGHGVVSYITNHSWTYGSSFVKMRKHLLKTFDKIWIENMHGDRKVSENGPDGSPSNTVFKIPGFSAGINQGVTISLFVKKEKDSGECVVRYRNDIDDSDSAARRNKLLGTLFESDFDEKYDVSDPNLENLYFMRPVSTSPFYHSWPSLDALRNEIDGKPCRNPGMQEVRGGAFIDACETSLADRMKKYYDPSIPWSEISRENLPVARTRKRYENPEGKRREVHKKEIYDQEKNLVRYALRPFDPQYAYYSGVTKVWNEHRPYFRKHHYDGSRYLVACRSHRSKDRYPVSFSTTLGDYGFLAGASAFFPFCNMRDGLKTPNLSAKAQEWVGSLVDTDSTDPEDVSSLVWYHALAICHSPRYISENADMLQLEWPKVPLPGSRDLLENSCALGADVASLLDLDSRPREGLIPESVTEFGLTKYGDNLLIDAGWGRKEMKRNASDDEDYKITGDNGKLVERDWNEDKEDNEQEVLRRAFDSFGLKHDRGVDLLGKAVDVYLNQENYWKGVPEKVWQCQIGDYMVIKKWLSYRECIFRKEPKIPLESKEARQVSEIVHRLTTLILMTDRLNANFAACCDDTWGWFQQRQ